MTIGIAWAVAIVICGLALLRRRLLAYRRKTDRRRRRELIDGVLLSAAAFGAAAAILMITVGPAGSGIRGLSVGLFFGTFLGYLIRLVTEPQED